MLALIINPLVQALRYEEYKVTSSKGRTGLREFLIDSSIKDKRIYNSLFWALQLEIDNDATIPELKDFFNDISEDLREKGM
jgi:hypothetical protein